MSIDKPEGIPSLQNVMGDLATDIAADAIQHWRILDSCYRGDAMALFLALEIAKRAEIATDVVFWRKVFHKIETKLASAHVQGEPPRSRKGEP